MVSSIEYRAPQNLNADVKSRPPGLDDSQGTTATDVNNDIDQEDDADSEKCFTSRHHNQVGVVRGTEDTTTYSSGCCNQKIAHNNDMVTLKEGCNNYSEGGVDVLQDDAYEISEPQKQVTNPCKRKVRWGSVLVRDYPIILGDNPSCSCGPPLTLDWEYQEYTSLGIDTYEFQHPHRRTIRELGRSHYQRKTLLSLAGFTEADFKIVEKEVNRVKLHRKIVQSVAFICPPLFMAADAVESAGRKIKRLLKKDHWKAPKY